MQQILGTLRRAVNDFKMIENGDKIAVGLSGGKDSIALLHALSLFRKFSPESFDLYAIHVDMGFFDSDGKFSKTLQDYHDYCRKNDITFYVEKTQISTIVFETKKEKNPCSLCSKMRRGALNTAAKNLGCNKIALGHHSDDVLETFFLSLIFEGRLSTFKPVTYLDKIDLTVLRPFVYTAEYQIKSAIKKHNLPVAKSLCPVDKFTKREEIKTLISEINEKYPGSKDLMEGALFHPERNNLWTRDD